MGTITINKAVVNSVGASGALIAPMVGETYAVSVEYQVQGDISEFDVLFILGGQVAMQHPKNMQSGGTYTSAAWFNAGLDGNIPWGVWLDPGRKTNAPVKPCRVGTFAPALPAAAIDFYQPLEYVARQLDSATVAHATQADLASRVTLMMGRPTSDSWQKVTSSKCTVNYAGADHNLDAQPADGPVKYPLFLFDKTVKELGSSYSATSESHLVLSNQRVNHTLLEKVTWAQLDEARAKEPFATYSKPESVIQSGDSRIHDFVVATIGANYRNSYSPYGAARALFKAVLSHITYYYAADRPPTAVEVLQQAKGDCGGFSILLVALFRNIGFAARTACGVWKGTDAGHCWSEMWFPGCGWMVSDGSAGNGVLENGEYAYYFGNIPDLNQRYAHQRGNTFAIGGAHAAWMPASLGNAKLGNHTGHTILEAAMHLVQADPVGQLQLERPLLHVPPFKVP